MATTRAESLREQGQRWLLSCATNPTDVQRRWNADEPAPILSGPHWRVVQAPLFSSVGVLRRIRPAHLGPILVDVRRDRAWWLLPPDLGDELSDLRQLTVEPEGSPLWCPPVVTPAEGLVWLEYPDGSGRLTDPVALGAAFGPGGARLPAEAFG